MDEQDILVKKFDVWLAQYFKESKIEVAGIPPSFRMLLESAYFMGALDALVLRDMEGTTDVQFREMFGAYQARAEIYKLQVGARK